MKTSDVILIEMNRVRHIGTALKVVKLPDDKWGLKAEWIDTTAKQYFDALQELLFRELKKENDNEGAKNS